MTNPLIGKLILAYQGDGTHALSAFVAEVGNEVWLLQRVQPQTGERLPIYHVRTLEQITTDRWAEIYPDWASYVQVRLEEHGEDDEQIVKLGIPRLAPLSDPDDAA